MTFSHIPSAKNNQFSPCTKSWQEKWERINNDETVKKKKKPRFGKLDMTICTIFKTQRGLIWNNWGTQERGRKTFLFNLLCRHKKDWKYFIKPQLALWPRAQSCPETSIFLMCKRGDWITYNPEEETSFNVNSLRWEKSPRKRRVAIAYHSKLHTPGRVDGKI